MLSLHQRKAKQIEKQKQIEQKEIIKQKKLEEKRNIIEENNLPYFEEIRSEENQYVVENIFEFDEVTPSLSQAIRLKKLEQEGNNSPPRHTPFYYNALYPFRSNQFCSRPLKDIF